MSSSIETRWLQYHDKDTEGLPGALPLALGMPVALTEHLDRSDDKRLLKGSKGYVHSWVWHHNDRIPTVVYVKFDNATWRLDGIDEDGVYPIYPIVRTWYLDKARKTSLLGVARRQLPLIPGFAMTAHCSQGKTLLAALLDLNVEARVDKSFGVVGASRVRHRDDVLILRPFPLWLFQRGAPEGPSLLLQKLRGEEFDWEAIHEARLPYATCTSCKQIRTYDCFEHKDWELVRANRSATCSGCKEGAKGVGNQSDVCFILLPRDDCETVLYKIQLGPGLKKRALSTGASKMIPCSACKRKKIEAAFPRAQLADLEDCKVSAPV